MNTQRVQYHEGQRLRVADLQAEQDYQALARRRHHIGEHTWGIVYGLALAEEGGQLLVQAGLAVDGYGRELLLPEPLVVAEDDLKLAFDDAGVADGDKADIWLLLVSTLDDTGRRWRDEVVLHLTAGGVAAPRQPFGVPEEGWDFEVWRDLPDGTFPVFLGRVTRNPFAMDPRERVYAGLVGAEVVSPAPRLPLRREGATEAPPAPQARLRLADGPRGRLALDLLGAEPLWLADDDGERRVVLRGDVSLAVDATQPDAAHVVRGVSYPVALPLPEVALPWSFYRTQIPILGPDGAPTDDPPLDQLRLEMFHPGDEADPAWQRLSFGTREAGVYRPCLTVRADCQVEAAGNIYVTGEVVETAIPADQSDSRFIEALLQGFHGGMAASDERLVPTPVLEPQIALEPNSVLQPGNMVYYKVQVTNHSVQPVTDVRIYGSFVNTNGQGSNPVEILTVSRLAGGATTVLSLAQGIALAAPAGQLIIRATVTALAADLAVVTQMAALALTIQ